MTALKVRTSSRPNALRPTFLIVGAAKAGTTSLYEYLRQHPQVFMSPEKEPSYFVEGYGVPTLDHYLGLFTGARPGQAIGEASTPYLSTEESAAWIRSVLGPIKIIIMLRNPARRAFSLYNWMAREGYEHAATFEEGLALEDKRRNDGAFRAFPPQFFGDYMYLSTGFYCRQVERFIGQFGRESVLVLLFEEFVRDPAAACRTVFEFLGINPGFAPAFERHNEGHLPRWIKAQYHLRNSYRTVPWLRPSRLREKLAEAAMALNLRWGSAAKPVMSPALYQELMARYQEDIGRLSQLVDRDLLSAWSAPGAPAMRVAAGSS